MAHHNAALFLPDHIGQMQRESFCNSKIVKSYSCERTKIACILSCALVNELIDAIKKEPYSLSVDASNNSKSNISYKFLKICLPSGVYAAKSSEISRKLMEFYSNVMCPGIINNTPYGVVNTNSNIGAVVKFVKPLVM